MQFKAPYVLALSASLLLTACGSSSPFIQSEANAGDVNATNGTTAPTGANFAFLFDEARFLTANSFVYDPIADEIVINNLPFDNTDASGNAYFNAGAIGATGFDFYRSTSVPGGEFNYFAVILASASGYSFGGSVATGNFAGFGYGGAYVERSTGGRPAAVPSSFIYNGDYLGTRVVGNGGAGTGDVGLVVGDARLEVDLLDLDDGGSAIGRITGRTLYDSTGANVANLNSLLLNLGTIDDATNTINNGTATILDSDGITAAQDGEWVGYFSGPNGEEIVGYVVVEGIWSDLDGNFDPLATDDQTIRETGVFIVER